MRDFSNRSQLDPPLTPCVEPDIEMLVVLTAKLIPGCGNLSDILESSHKAVPFGVFAL